MKRRFTVLAVVGSCALGAPISGIGTAAARTAAPVASAANSCTYGYINHVRKCLMAGEYCSRRYRHQYLKYGFTCSERDDRGDWHLVRR